MAKETCWPGAYPGNTYPGSQASSVSLTDYLNYLASLYQSSQISARTLLPASKDD